MAATLLLPAMLLPAASFGAGGCSTKLSSSVRPAKLACRPLPSLEVRAAVQGVAEPEAAVAIPDRAVTERMPSSGHGRRAVVNKATAVAAAAALGVGAAQRRQARAVAAATCQVAPSAAGIDFCDSVVGNGVQASKGMLIKAHYTGKLLSGSVFDSSYNRGRPLVFRVGVGEVIRGWDQGILGIADIPPMKAGGKRTLRIPAELGYGSRGAGCRGGNCTIPPDSSLVFDVEFVGQA